MNTQDNTAPEANDRKAIEAQVSRYDMNEFDDCCRWDGFTAGAEWGIQYARQEVAELRKENEQKQDEINNLRYEIFHATAEIDELRKYGDELNKQRDVRDEILSKAKSICDTLRNADSKMFPTLVIRAEAIEDFIDACLGLNIRKSALSGTKETE